MPRMFARTRSATTLSGFIALVLTLALGTCGPAWARPPLPLSTDDAFQRDCLKAHNGYRARHGAPPLKTDQATVDYAKQRVTLFSEYEGLSHGHAGLRPGYGENTFWAGSSSPDKVTSCSDAVKTWYSQGVKYDYNHPGFSQDTGFFTQVVWKSTTTLGCARAAGRGSAWYETYIVCMYQPAGNIVTSDGSYFSKNVGRPA
ncbi:CAP family protein [Streptomyces sp. NPDC004629]|uniref:CAP family protein n=1 Tax=Streptomyces sp. NPDC004629 TaxID=3364705 RepID=UPI0036808C04